ncbi:hypothetical protein PO909_000849, partial [Leuciscus waleckii]
MSGEWLQGDESSVMTPFEEEKCEELWERVEGVRHKLTRVLNPAKLTPYLRQCKVIDEQDEDEVLNSSQYPMRISRAGRLLDILRGRGERGLQAFMESLEFYHPEQFTQLTGQQPTQRCSIMLDEEGPEGLTQFLLLEVRKLREQLRGSRLCERRLSQRCRVAEEERSRAERKAQELRQDRIQQERMRHDLESCTRELGLLKDRHLEQAVKYSRALEEQRKASVRERELLTEVEQLRKRLLDVEKRADDGSAPSLMHHSEACDEAPAGPKETLPLTVRKTEHNSGNQALLDILQQDRREAVEQRQELCGAIARLQGELESSEAQRERLASQCEQLQLRLRTLQLDWETEQSRSVSYFTQIMELERERDQALRSRDGLQLEFTDCLLEKNRLRKRMAELQNSLEQQQRETEKSREQREQSATCLHCSHLSLFSEDQCFGPCCSVDLSPSPLTLRAQKSTSQAQICELSEDFYCSNSEENLLTLECNTEKDINRLSTFPFPPCMNSIHRRANVEFDLNSWGSDENETHTEDLDSCRLSSWSSLPSQLFPPDVINVIEHSSSSSSSSSSPRLAPALSSSPKSISLAGDITIIGGNRTGVFVQTVRAGSPAERCGLKEGSELLELDQVLLGDGRVRLSQCTSEVAHFSLQWWTEPNALKHTHNQEGYSRLMAELSSPSFTGADSFYVRVNLDLSSHGDPPCLRVRCDDVLHVTDTRYNGKYQWRCVRVDKHTGAPLQAGAVPNYNRAQQLLLVRLRTMAIEQNQCRKKFCKKTPEHIRLIKAVASNYRAIGSSNQVLYTLSNRHEEQLIPFSLVQMVRVSSKRPVVFCPSLLSRGIIERLLQPAESGLDFNTCHPGTQSQ